MCDAKSYLRKIELLDANINNKLDDLHQLKSMVTKITATISPICVSGSGGKDKLGDAVAKIVDLQDEINRKIDRFVDMKREIGEVIEQVQDADQVKVLHKRYFEYKPWEQIACEMNISFRHVCRVHGYALQAIEALLDGNRKEGNGDDNASGSAI